jgi:uncharacterized protein YabN with tetrapyrrole methylase and pyrophosphatase domain
MLDDDGRFTQRLTAAFETLSALDATYVAQKVSADVGFDFTSIDLVLEKVKEEFREVLEAFEDRASNPDHYAEEIGDSFFALVNLCRHSGLDPEELIAANARKYLERCRFVEQSLQQAGQSWKDVPLETIYGLWRDAKKANL